jgi:hypothetical protein
MESSVPENLIITDREQVVALDDREYVKHGVQRSCANDKAIYRELVSFSAF